jgi:acyl-CoA hydrolase
MQSTARKGTTFTIVSKVAMMTDDRTGVGHVVTEYGAVNLRGTSAKERALALIDIAYLSFREQPLAEARRITLI